MMRAIAFAVGLAFAASAANAQDSGQPADPPAPTPAPAPAPAPETAPETTPETAPAPAPETAQHTADSVKDAPRPENATNIEVGPSRDGEGFLWIPRVLLFPVRVAGEVFIFPIRWGLYAFEVYSLEARFKSIFFNEEDTVGVFPTALIETGFGLNFGGRLILRRIVGDVGLTGRAGFGGRFKQIFSTKISTNDTWKRLVFDLEASFEIRPKDRFYGIGNGDELETAPAMPLDPFGADTIKSRFRQDAIRVGAAAGYRPSSAVTLTGSAAIVDRTFANPDSAIQQIETNFDTAALTGYDDGTRTVYGELELAYDTRRAPNKWEGDAKPSTGSLFRVFAGYTAGLGDDPARYVRYGLDLQRYFRLAGAPRSLALRFYTEAVTGNYNEVSFYDLPRLGGPLLLRGYDLDQFRDRVASFGSAEYSFDAVDNLSGFLFTDVGRVNSVIEDLDFSEMRVGFGGGLEFHTRTSFISRLTLASSKDGGFFATLSFDPVYDTRARVERK